MKALTVVLNPFSWRFQQRCAEARPRLVRIAYAMTHDSALAEDLVQETLRKALASEEARLRDEARLFAWLAAILRNLCRDHWRDAKPSIELEMAETMAADSAQGPEAQADAAMLQRRVRAAVASLEPSQREVVALVDLEEMSYRDAAAVLGVPIGTVMSRLSRARAALVCALKDSNSSVGLSAIPLRRVK